jgi:hypothetical protein
MSNSAAAATMARVMARVANKTPARPDHALRVAQRNLLVTFKGRTHVTSSTITYHRSHVRGGAHTTEAEFRLIDAEHVHGDEQAFWRQKHDFYKKEAPLMPLWDRVAHVAILTTRKAERVPQEAAFRLMAVYLKLMFLPSITTTVSTMLPLWMSHNLQGLMGRELKEKNGDGEGGDAEKKDGATDSSSAAAPAEEAAAPPTPPPTA